MAARPRPLLAVAALGGAAVLTACQKPPPLATVVAAGHSYPAQASGWCVQGSQPRCKQFDRGVPTVTVDAGQVVGVDVDRTIAKGQWLVTLERDGSKPVPVAAGEGSHYESFVAPSSRELGASSVLMRVSVQRSETGIPEDRVGQWFYTLRVRG